MFASRILQYLFGRTSEKNPPDKLTARKRLGNRGEDHALALLKKRGDKLIARNISFKCGELDLITRHKDTLVFTEVRSRSSDAFGSSAESINHGKQKRIRQAADWYLARTFKGGPLPCCRFDIVWINAKDGEIVESGIIEGAF
jgi:putative endonuclease